MYMKRSLRLHNYLKTFLFLAIFGFNAQVSFGQTLIAGWDFQTTTNGGTAALASPNTPSLFNANVGIGTLYLNGTNGSSTWSQSSELSAFGGTATNAGGTTGLSTGTSSPSSLALLGGTSNSGNGKSIVFRINMTGYSNLIISYATQRTTTGYNSQVWEYSSNGSTWTSVGSVTPPSSFGSTIQTLPSISGLNNITTAFLKLTVTGSTGGGSSNNRLDNVQLNATPIPVSTTWNGTSWSDGLPTAPTEAIIDGIYNSNAGGTQIGFTAKKLTVTTNGNLTINAGTNITVQDDVINNGLLTVESNANLVQVNNTTNSGTISVKRETNQLMRFDYVMWSSPVDGTQTLTGFSPLTSVSPTVRFYNYDSATNLYTSILDAATTEFTNATGYLIRLPFDHPTAPTTWTGTFSGVPNNGPISLGSLTSGLYYATGNPYPSTISADAFIAANSLNDALYFWRKTNGATGSAYATYTTAGGTSPAPGTTASPSSGVPNGTIQVGQGFIAKANGTSLVFNNTMRTTNTANQTFRSTSSELPTTIEKNRFWLNLSNATETIGQTLVSYMTGATNGLDAQIDGKYINDSATALTSLIAGEEFAIQGKTLPFAASDVVSLGFKTETAGNYSISIFDKDGLFSDNGQIIYLRDNLTNTIQNLNSGAYNFTSQAGVFNGRFDVVYQNALTTDVVDFTSNNVTVYNQNNVLNINSGSNTMSTVKVYDVLGRVLAQSNKVNATQAQINVPATNQTLIVQITSSEGIVVVKKVAN